MLLLTVGSPVVVRSPICGDVGGVMEPNGCLLSVVSTRAGSMVVFGTRAVWTVVFGADADGTETVRVSFWGPGTNSLTLFSLGKGLAVAV